MRVIVPVPLGWRSLPIQMTRSPNANLRAIAVFMTMPQMIAGAERTIDGQQPWGRRGLFRYGALIAARGHRPSINVGFRPPNISHA
jgi:hypothetical protein